MLNTASIAAVVVLSVGALIFWSHPGRMINRIVFSVSINICAWLACLNMAVTSQSNGMFWIQMSCAVGAFVPMHFWLVKEIISGDFGSLVNLNLRKLAAWILISGVLASVCFTEYFIPSHSTAQVRVRGWGYYGYYWVVLGLYAYLFSDAAQAMKRLVGVRRLELQVWLVGGCAMTATILLLMGLNAVTHDRLFILLQPLVLIIYYASTVYAITTFRIFDARQLVLVAIEKFLLITFTSAVAFFVHWSVDVLPAPFGLMATTAVALWFAVTLNDRLDLLFKFFPQATSARQAAFMAARRETHLDGLEKSFLDVLRGWGHTDHAILLSGARDSLKGGGIILQGNSVLPDAMRKLLWVTPERLARERPTPERMVVARFLEQNSLGILVVGEGPTLSVLSGVGVSASRRPFTYPQVTQLIELTSIMVSALERAHFSAKVQHAEQLATVGLLGASLAHEIRNPLVSIKTFVQLLPTHHHDPKFREKFFSLIGDEVARIDQLTQQLLDLAAPRTYEAKLIELHPLLRSSLELVATKAVHRDIQFVTEFGASPDRAYTDASAAKQVMLNLCFNAIQAVESHQGRQRWVKISTRNTPNGIEMAVADSGSGISAEIRPKLFQPFQTTKSSGFGLGLAICSDILANLNATISVDPLQSGCGAVFRVTFPCQPLSS